MRRIPNGTWVAIILAGAIGLTIIYAVLGGDEPLFVRDRGNATSTVAPAPTP
ncbi:MAG: hypothetical protein ACE5EF_01220 [Dehalococcoidia bacterium]